MQQGRTTRQCSYHETVLLLLQLANYGHEVVVRHQASETGLEVDPHADTIDIDTDDCTAEDFGADVARGVRVLAELHGIALPARGLHAV